MAEIARSETDILILGSGGAGLFAAAILLLRQVSPVVGHIHGFGRLRSVAATLVQMLLVGALLWLILGRYFPVG